MIESQAFDAEFQNAIIRGDISALTGTFTGRLDVNALDAVSRLNIAGRAVATTTVSQQSSANPNSHGFNDDGIWKNVMSVAVEVPQSMNGAWCASTMQDQIVDVKGDNQEFPTQYQILVDGVPYFTSAIDLFGAWFEAQAYQLHELVVYLTGPGTHTIVLQYRWFPAKTNVYPQFYGLTMRTDVLRK